jgi:hypothetical protein
LLFESVEFSLLLVELCLEELIKLPLLVFELPLLVFDLFLQGSRARFWVWNRDPHGRLGSPVGYRCAYVG